jgi:hypothetical protein
MNQGCFKYKISHKFLATAKPFSGWKSLIQTKVVSTLPWTNCSWQDEPLAEFSTLEVAACHAMHLLPSIAIWPNLQLKTQPKQLLGSLPLDIVLPVLTEGEGSVQLTFSLR